MRTLTEWHARQKLRKWMDDCDALIKKLDIAQHDLNSELVWLLTSMKRVHGNIDARRVQRRIIRKVYGKATPTSLDFEGRKRQDPPWPKHETDIER